MNRRIPQSFINSLLASVDIVEIVKARTQITPDNDIYRGNCPFHEDTTRLLVVDPGTQQYSCTECGVEGSAIGFCMYFDGVHFIDCIRYLASLSGISINGVVDDDVLSEPYNNIVALLDDVATFFQQELTRNKDVLDYLYSRGFSDHSIEKYRIGYAPADRLYLEQQFPNKKAMLARAGVCGLNKDKSQFARFRNRIMLPVINDNDEVIGFGGRSFDDAEPKYLNSPASSHFNKSSVLYGLSFLSDASTVSPGRANALIVEGYFDVVALHQFGFTNAIAPLGTAISSQHIQILYERFSSVCFAFDGDQAGNRAAMRALSMVLPLVNDNFRARFCVLPVGYDPDSLLLESGAEALSRCLQNSLSESEFLIYSHTSEKNITGIGPVAALCAELKPLISSMVESDVKDECITTLSEFADIPLEHYF